jgi:hypothetical protein
MSQISPIVVAIDSNGEKPWDPIVSSDFRKNHWMKTRVPYGAMVKTWYMVYGHPSLK